MKRFHILLLVLLLGTTTAFAQESNDRETPDAMAIDTLCTADKFKKVILFDDYTWEYLELERPDIDEESLMANWDTEAIHAYKEIDVSAMPDSVTLILRDSTHKFCMPAKGYVISRYGWRHKRPHRGIDIPQHIGDSIHSAFDGIVRISEGSSNTGGYGNLVIVRHPNGLETYYAHLSKILVKENEVVSAGEVIGLAGSTGRSTGPHLHFETRYMGKAFDPERVIDVTNNCLRTDTVTIYKQYYNPASQYSNRAVAAQPSSTPTQSHASTSTSTSKVYYTIRKGDNLGKIAKKYHTTISKLCKLNHIKETTILQIGRKLRVR
ncbi:MAG: peptidoglycan DD-metalloendopeptidase family protein [Bacteroidales bacterium]|nr:peptidoglycan DD-metalloendopeptidase family protein [Bacteroidales bacterium]